MYLTKSRFKVGISCPTKLFFESNNSKFDNNDSDNEFIESLAKGGLQVGEMSKLYFPGGIEIDGKSEQEQLQQTSNALKKDNVIIYEAAIKVNHKFIRIDILEKKGELIKIIEVKSKNCDGDTEAQFFNKRNNIKSNYRPYLEDVAFQYLVCLEFFKENIVVPYLMMPDKNIESTVDGLYQRFMIVKEQERDVCRVVEGTSLQDLGLQIMKVIKVLDTVESLIKDDYYKEHNDFLGKNFKEIIEWYESLILSYENQQDPHFSVPNIKCRDCQFKSKDIDRSGFHLCMKEKNNWKISDFDRPKVWDIWSSPNLEDFILENKWFMDEISPSDLNPGKRFDRQSLQIQLTNSESNDTYVDIDGLRKEFSSFIWPLNLIDFETLAPAIPLFKGYRPYQGFCFQFSHHILHKDGTVEHKNQYLGMGQGMNPSFKFIDHLYKALSANSGDVLMYSFHENTYLNYMIKLLWKESPFNKEYTDKLITFLQSLTTPSGDIKPKWREGERKMKDMAVMVRSYYWHPYMKGSNSIKKVLPAIMNDSQFIQNKYSEPIYGINSKIKSLNFNNKKWVEFDQNRHVMDPYKNLPDLEYIIPVGLSNIENMSLDSNIKDGGAAMTAWAYMQFEGVSNSEKIEICNALKRYCELDTMAMVIIIEAWRDMINTNSDE